MPTEDVSTDNIYRSWLYSEKRLTCMRLWERICILEWLQLVQERFSTLLRHQSGWIGWNRWWIFKFIAHSWTPERMMTRARIYYLCFNSRTISHVLFHNWLMIWMEWTSHKEYTRIRWNEFLMFAPLFLLDENNPNVSRGSKHLERTSMQRYQRTKSTGDTHNKSRKGPTDKEGGSANNNAVGQTQLVETHFWGTW